MSETSSIVETPSMAPSSAAEPKPPEMLLGHYLKTLRLPSFKREFEKQAELAAKRGEDHVRYLLRLAELELIDREQRLVERRITGALFDRLTHHVHILKMNGESYRLSEAKKRLSQWRKGRLLRLRRG